MNGMFPGNHRNSEVAAGNATVYFFYFSLFLKGGELFFPIYSTCVCVNTFILNLKLINITFLKCHQSFCCFFYVSQSDMKANSSITTTLYMLVYTFTD